MLHAKNKLFAEGSYTFIGKIICGNPLGPIKQFSGMFINLYDYCIPCTERYLNRQFVYVGSKYMCNHRGDICDEFCMIFEQNIDNDRLINVHGFYEDDDLLWRSTITVTKIYCELGTRTKNLAKQCSLSKPNSCRPAINITRTTMKFWQL